MPQNEDSRTPIVLVFLVNGTAASPMGVRAQEFARRLSGDFQVHVAYRSARKVRSIWTLLCYLRRIRPSVCYVLDMGYSGVLAAGLYRAISRCKIVVDTGDAIFALARSLGRGPVGLALTKALEFIALRISHRLVVRSHFHQEWLAQRGFTADVIPDGVDTEQFRPMDVSDLRRKYGVEGFKTIGVLGSVTWNKCSQSCYGWDLVEVIRLLRDQPVKGMIVGDGSGIDYLKARCADYGILDRVIFLGFVPYDKLPPILNLMDVCLSTQTNDLVGHVRTTGKLPLYLACGCFVLATDVGEAARVLPRAMRCSCEGVSGEHYPSKLAQRVRSLIEGPSSIHGSEAQVLLAKEHFEYCRLSEMLRHTLLACLRSSLVKESTLSERPSI